jgi:hypothetical protein
MMPPMGAMATTSTARSGFFLAQAGKPTWAVLFAAASGMFVACSGPAATSPSPSGNGGADAGLAASGGSPGSGPGSGGTGTDAPTLGDTSVAGSGGASVEDGSTADVATTDGQGGGTGSGGAPGPLVFRHPGLLSSKADLDYIKQQVQAGAAPWRAAFNQMSSSGSASLSYQPSPRATVSCGRYSMPNIGCLEERNDSHAAYAHALLWYLTGNQANASKAIAIMNAYATVLKAHTMANATLQTGWSISVMIRAAEIIKHSGAGWASADIDRFSAMVRAVYVRDLTQAQGGVDGLISIFGNWALTIIEGITACGVFLDDRALFERGLEMWRARFPSYVYLSTDGALPVAPPDAKDASRAQLVAYWFGQGEFRDGVSAETCRDIEHLQYGLAAAANVAEIAFKQGIDLYQEQQPRFIAMLEFHAPFVTGTGAPSWLCGGGFTRPGAFPTWEIAYNHFHNRRAVALPNTLRAVNAVRPTGSTTYNIAWESLTHAELGVR